MATEYVVFWREHEKVWHEHARISARSATSAIKEAFDSIQADPEHTRKEWSATPARSWKPVTVKVETKTALKFS